MSVSHIAVKKYLLACSVNLYLVKLKVKYIYPARSLTNIGKNNLKLNTSRLLYTRRTGLFYLKNGYTRHHKTKFWYIYRCNSLKLIICYKSSGPTAQINIAEVSRTIRIHRAVEQ